MVLEFLGLSPGRPERHPGRGPGQGRGRAPLRRDRHGPRPRRRPAVAVRDPRRARERDRLGRGDGRLAPTASCTCSRSRTTSASRSTSTSSAPIADRTPIVADMVPGGRYTASDLYDAGGVALVMRELLKRPGLLHGDAPTVDGRTLAEIAAAAVETPGQQVVVPIETPLKPTGGLADPPRLARARRLRGQAGRPRAPAPSRAGPRLRVGDRVLRRGPRPADRAGRRRRHPQRGPGRRPRDAGDAQRHRGARRRGPRRRGRAHHRRPVLRRHPRADDRPHRAGGGARRPDRRRPRGRHASSSTSTARRSTSRSRPTRSRGGSPRWTPPAPRYAGGVMAKYAALVGSASEGAVTTGPRMTGQPPRPVSDVSAVARRSRSGSRPRPRRSTGRPSTRPGRASASTTSSTRSG